MSLRKPRLEPRTIMRPAPLVSALAGLVAVAVLAGCQPEPNSGRGFTLPVGNVDAGKSAFLALECQACHIVKEIEQLSVADGKPRMSVPLGGEVTRIQTYGELVTSIINPSHRLARAVPGAEQAAAAPGKSDSPVSPMTNYNQVMTVQQLIDLTTFLQSLYRIRPYEPTEYPIFPM